MGGWGKAGVGGSMNRLGLGGKWEWPWQLRLDPYSSPGQPGITSVISICCHFHVLFPVNYH